MPSYKLKNIAPSKDSATANLAAKTAQLQTQTMQAMNLANSNEK